MFDFMFAKPAKQQLLKSITRFIFLLLILYASGCKGKMKPVGYKNASGETIYQNAGRKQMPLRLPDGSELVMKDSTLIRLFSGFNGSNRKIFLQGRAMFTVHPDSARPFIIHTGALRCMVMDTSVAIFTIAAEDSLNKGGEEVLLLTGTLRVMKSYPSKMDNEPILLRSGEMMMINKGIDLMETEKLDSAEWKQSAYAND